MNSKTLAALAGLCVAAPAFAQITGVRNDLATAFVNIANNGTATRIGGATTGQDDCSYSFVGVTNAGIVGANYRPCSNGFVQFLAAPGAGATYYVNSGIPANTPLPAGTQTTVVGVTAPQTICVAWDDYITGAATVVTNGVWAQTGDAVTAFGGITVGGVAAVGNVTIIQFQGMDLFGIANPTNANFELMVFANPVFSGGQNVYAVAVYGNMTFGGAGLGSDHNDGVSATTGYSAGASGVGSSVQWGAGSATGIAPNFAFYGNLVPAGTALAYVPTPGAVALLGLGGLIAGRRRRA